MLSFLSKSTRFTKSCSCYASSSYIFIRNYSKLKFLVVDCYGKAGRDDLEKGGMKTAGQLYCEMLDYAAKGKAEFDVVFPADQGFKIPDLTKYDGVGWTGSSLTVYHKEDPQVTLQYKLCEAVINAGVPQFGSCWGLQLGAAIFGAEVKRNPKGREMGIGRKVTLNEAGITHKMFEGRRNISFDVFSSHDDEVVGKMPSDITVLAGNSFSHIQALVVPYKETEFWAVQYHPEYDIYQLARLVSCRIAKLIKNGNFIDENDAINYINDLETLWVNPQRKDISWRLGIDEDVLDIDQRLTEVKNWIKYVVIPYNQRKLNKLGNKTTWAMSFDIDGVLVCGNRVVESAKSVLNNLNKRNIPFVLVTNGGGVTESQKALQLSEKLEAKITEEQVIMAHSPMRKLIEKHKNDYILVVGKRSDSIKEVVKSYGFEKVITTEEWHHLSPISYPDLKVEKKGDGQLPPKIGAVFCLIDPLYWGRDIQIVCDAIQKSFSTSPIPIYSSCADLFYAAEYETPRLGSGSFAVALESVCTQALGIEKFTITKFGKPEVETFRYAEGVLEKMASRNNKEVTKIYMVGDNQMTDIQGARNAGEKWISILTKTGMYQGGPHNAHHVCLDVEHAYDLANSLSSPTEEKN